MPLSVRAPEPLTLANTGHAALDRWWRRYTSPDATTPNDAPFPTGVGLACASLLSPALFDHGETEWDDAAARALPRAELAQLRAAAEQQYKSANTRVGVLQHIVPELGANADGQALLRAALRWPGASRAHQVLIAALFEAGGDENLTAIATAPFESGPLLMSVLTARLLLDSAAASAILDAAALPDAAERSPMVRAVAAFGHVPSPSEVRALVAVIGDPRVTEPVSVLLSRVKADAALLDALLASNANSTGMADQLARFDELRALSALARVASHTTLADRVVSATFTQSRHPQVVELAAAVAAAREAAGEHKSKVKLMLELARTLAAQHSVAFKPPKKSAAPAPLAAEPWPDAPAHSPRARTDVATDRAAIVAALRDAGLESRVDDLVVSGVVLDARRANAPPSTGSSRLGGLPDLVEAAQWPVRKGVALGFVGQLRLSELAATTCAALLPADGLLAFFINDETDGDDYCRAGCVVFIPADQLPSVKPCEPPSSFQKLRASRPARQPWPGCAVEFFDFVACVEPSNRRVKLAGDTARHYSALSNNYRPPDATFVFGARPGYDGEIKPTERVLLHVASDEQAAFMFGDMESITFVISEKALAAQDFSKVRTWVGEG